MTDPPAEILRRLRPIPTHVGRPTTAPRDVNGVRPDGTSCHVNVLGGSLPVVLVFLSVECLGCHDLWAGLGAMWSELRGTAQLAAITKPPGEEDPAAVAALAGSAVLEAGVEVVMSSAAYADYGVAGAPFLVVVGADGVRAESVAWGVDQTLSIATRAVRTP